MNTVPHLKLQKSVSPNRFFALIEFSIVYALGFVVKELLAIPLHALYVIFGGDKKYLKGWPPVIRELAILAQSLLYWPLFLLIAMTFAAFVYVISFKEQFEKFADGTAEYRMSCWKALFKSKYD